VPADDAQATGRAHDGITAIETIAGHPLVAEGEVVFDGIGGVHGGEARGDLLRHLPVA
jgi:hypothetical protein